MGLAIRKARRPKPRDPSCNRHRSYRHRLLAQTGQYQILTYSRHITIPYRPRRLGEFGHPRMIFWEKLFTATGVTATGVTAPGVTAPGVTAPGVTAPTIPGSRLDRRVKTWIHLVGVNWGAPADATLSDAPVNTGLGGLGGLVGRLVRSLAVRAQVIVGRRLRSRGYSRLLSRVSPGLSGTGLGLSSGSLCGRVVFSGLRHSP